MTNQLYTFEIIDGFRMNDGKINVDYFAGQAAIYGVNGGEALYHEVRGKKPAEKVAINVLCSWINFELFAHGYRKYICTWQQVKKALGSQLDEIMQYITNSIIAEREEE